MLIIQELVWKPQFVEKIRRKHGVSQEEVRQVLRQPFKVRRAMKGEVRGEDLYAAYGRTSTGRYLTVGFILKRGRKALILSARDMTDAERRFYGKR